jgi:N-acyl-L-homoserine lactone synthetase
MLNQHANDIVEDAERRRNLLHGYRFRICERAEDAMRALAVRRQVYRGLCGYEVPVPDAYDHRSWLLLAEHEESGEAVGTMRLTPRSAGALESEEYFTLLPHLRSPRVLEITRFAILPAHRDGRGSQPAVAVGLFGLVSRMLVLLGVDYAVVCSKPERMWTYQWMCFERTGLTAPYGKLGAVPHELLTLDFRFGAKSLRSTLPMWDFFFGPTPPEMTLPQRTPRLGVGVAAPERTRRTRAAA